MWGCFARSEHFRGRGKRTTLSTAPRKTCPVRFSNSLSGISAYEQMGGGTIPIHEKIEISETI